jgi:hypothetical protein
MGFYAMAMGQIAVALDRAGQRPGTDLVLKFLEHFAGIRDAIDGQGLWDDQDGMYYDRLLTPSGTAVPVKVHSMVGMIPALAVGVVDESMLRLALVVGKQFASLLGARGLADPAKLTEAGLLRGTPGDQRLLLSVAGPDRLPRLLSRLFDENEFLSAHGLRSLSAYHRDHPYQIDVEGVHATIDYEPAESTTPMFGGNSNWRGPIWFPLNYLVISMLERYQRFFGDDLTIEYPTGSGRRLTFGEVASDLQDRLISLFAAGPDGRRPCFGGVTRLQEDPAWRDNLVLSEYFHGDNGAGLGASHQTGWTGLIADVIRRRHGALPSTARFWPTWAPAPRGPRGPRGPRAPPRANESGPAVCLSRRAPRRTHASGRGAPHRLGVFGDLLGAVLAARAACCVVSLRRYEQRDNRDHVIAALLGAGRPGLRVSRELGGVASRPRRLVLPVLDFPARHLVDPGDVVPQPGVLR